ncbi:hypothetical protein EIP86_007603 [Pleurotus ostreatoroseus]|nr:hypothetical protein EIP86_007603 [Pleurotus ostreatoroseus]
MRRLVVSSRSSSRTSFVIRLPTLSTLSGTYFYCVVAVSILMAILSKTVTALDVVYALKRSGRTLYGFGA